MSRTVVIREIKRIRKTEISKFEELTKKDIIQDYENIISLFECEYLSDKYSSQITGRCFLGRTAWSHQMVTEIQKYHKEKLYDWEVGI